MALNLQGVAFGFFEDLTSDEQQHLCQILHGPKGTTKEPELPWPCDAENDFAEEVSDDGEVIARPAVVDCAAVDARPPTNGPSVAAPATAAVVFPPQLYHQPIPVLHNVLTYAGVYLPPQGGVPTVPITYVSMGPAPVGPPPVSPHSPATESMGGGGPVVSPDGHHDQPDLCPTNTDELMESPLEDGKKSPEYDPDMQFAAETPDSERAKILGGKTYERRNKKRRPRDYYEKIAGDPEPGGNVEAPAAEDEYDLHVAHTSSQVFVQGPCVDMSGPYVGVNPPVRPDQVAMAQHVIQPHQVIGGPFPILSQTAPMLAPNVSGLLGVGLHIPPPPMPIPPAPHQVMPPTEVMHHLAGGHVITAAPPGFPLVGCPDVVPPPAAERAALSADRPQEAPQQSAQHGVHDVSISSHVYSDDSRTDADCKGAVQEDACGNSLVLSSVDHDVVQANLSFGSFTDTDDVHNQIISPRARGHVADKANVFVMPPVGVAASEDYSSQTQPPVIFAKDSSPEPDVVCSNEPLVLEPEVVPPGDDPCPAPQAEIAPDVHTSDPVVKSPPPELVPVATLGENGNEGRPTTTADPPNPSSSQPPSSASSSVTIDLTTAPQIAAAAAVPAPAPTISKPKVSSWAGLFRGTSTAETATVVYNTSAPPSANAPNPAKTAPAADKEKPTEAEASVVTAGQDKISTQLGVLLKSYRLCHRATGLQPRGLVNRGNWCYVNATLQALLACPPFYHLVRALPSFPALARGPTSTPVIDSVVEFVNEFGPLPKLQEKNNKGVLGGKGNIKQDIPVGSQFEPTYVYKMLQNIKYDGFKHGRQEDAEEFLSCILNGLHEEMVASIKVVDDLEDKQKPSGAVTANGDVDALLEGGGGGGGTLEAEEKQAQDDNREEDDGQWEQVGPRNKSVITRMATVDSSPVSDIFRGQIRSVLHKPGAKESATLQPFFTLQLDIQSDKVLSVSDALDRLVSRESLQGYTCAKTKTEVDATRRMMLEDLPPVLLLHLKCFIYDKSNSAGSQKVVRQVDFDADLELNKELLSPNARTKYPQAQRKYKLFAVVKHVGMRAVGGHYTADIYHAGLATWVHCDDNHVYTMPLPQVLKFRAPRVPYLLYYRRADLS